MRDGAGPRYHSQCQNLSLLKESLGERNNPTQQYSVSPFASVDYDKNASENSFHAGVDFIGDHQLISK